MEPVIFNNEIVRKHSLWKDCGCLLNKDISNRDYPGKNYFNPQIEALDMDSYEKKNCGGNADCTTDAVIGLSSCRNKTLYDHRLLLVELRMNYQSADTLSKSSMENKVIHTKQLLGSGCLPINRKTIFVFTEKVAPQARHWVEAQKHEGGEIQNFVVYSVKEFRDNILSYDELPYVAIYDAATISNDFQVFIRNNDWQGVFDKFDFWIKLANKIQYSNVFEYHSLANIIVSEWKKVRAVNPCFPNEEIEIDAQIIEEKIGLQFTFQLNDKCS